MRFLCFSLMLLAGCDSRPPEHQLLHVSYDATRELYRKLNRVFIENYRAETGIDLRIRMSHGGSTSQARSVRDGLPADVVSFALWSDVDAVRKKKLLGDDWETRLPDSAAPYFSTIVFVVRKGNPKHIKDWLDLVKPGVQVITPSPKTGGGAKLTVLAAWGAALRRGDDPVEYLRKLFANVPVLDSGSRGSAMTFARRGIGDVQLTWENEAILEMRECPGEMEIVYPPISFKAVPPVAWLDTVVERGSKPHAVAYFKFLYTPKAQRLIAENGYRPGDKDVLKEFAGQFPPIDLITLKDLPFMDWDDVQKKLFDDGALFDQFYEQ